MPNYPREQLLSLYNSLPKELQEAIFSADNADKMFDICQRNNITDDKTISEIAKNSGYVLMGVLPPEELAKVFEKEIGLKKETAKNVSWEVSRFIFLPVRQYLEALYSAKSFEKTEVKPEPPKKKKTDSYREILE